MELLEQRRWSSGALLAVPDVRLSRVRLLGRVTQPGLLTATGMDESKITVFTARRVHTMNPSMPHASAVAVGE